MVTGAGEKMNGFTDSEQHILIERYNHQEDAHNLLLRAGYPSGQIPAFRIAQSFWSDVSYRLEQGVFVDGREKILEKVYQQYPGTYPARPHIVRPSGRQEPNTRPEDRASPSEPARQANRTSIIVAIIGATAVIIPALLTSGFGVFDGGSSPRVSATSPPIVPSTAASHSPTQAEKKTTKPAGRTHTITIRQDPSFGKTFEPESLRIPPGDRIVWLNKSSGQCDIQEIGEELPFGVNQSRIIPRGKTLSMVFRVSQIYAMKCRGDGQAMSIDVNPFQ